MLSEDVQAGEPVVCVPGDRPRYFRRGWLQGCVVASAASVLLIAALNVVVPGEAAPTQEAPSTAKATAASPFYLAPAAMLALKVEVPITSTPGELVQWGKQRASVQLAGLQVKSERVSMMIAPVKLTKTAAAAQVTAYLETAGPTRVYDIADPAEGVPAMSAVGNTYVALRSGEAAPLTVQATAGVPVNFTTMDGGAFQNGLAYITLVADAQGKATAMWTATPGAFGGASVLAASPRTSGQASFLMNVEFPKIVLDAAR